MRPPSPECISRDKGAEFQKASSLLKSALSKIPYVDNPTVSGSVSATVCPVCCGGAVVNPANALTADGGDSWSTGRKRGTTYALRD